MKGAKQQIQSALSGVDTSSTGSTLGKQLTDGMAKGFDFQAVAGKLQSLGGQLESVGGKLTSAITKPAVIAAGAVAAIGTAVGVSALNAYGTWEQATGGIETLFKGSAKKVTGYADQAYKTAGVSANAYMTTVTSFSASLLQGLGGDTEKAADLANTALVDMSDNANKFGSNMTDIQNAYQGFAKQNYTMLDNLKLGYGGTKEEMQRLLADAEKLTGVKYDMGNFADVISAIHAVQDEMGVTGTTALEASSTIEGSVASMKGAWANWLTELGKTDGDVAGMTSRLAEAVGIAMGNIIPRIKQIFENLVASIPAMFDGLRSTLPPAFMPMVDMVQRLFDAWQGLSPEVKKFVGVFAGVAVAAGPVLTVLGKVVGVVGKFVGALRFVGPVLGALTSPVGLVIAAVAALVAGFVYAWNNIDGFKEFFVDMWERIKAAAQTVVDWFTETALPALSAAWDWLVEVTQPLQQIFQDVWQGIQDAVQVVVDWFTGSFLPAFSGVWDAVKGFVSAAWDVIQPRIQAAIDFIRPILEAFMAWIGAVWPVVWENVKTIISTVWDVISAYVTTAMGVIQGVISAVTAVIQGDWSGAWEAIKGIFSTVWDGIKSIVSSIFGGIAGLIGNTLGSIKGVWSSSWNLMLSLLNSVWDGIKSGVSNGIINVMNAVSGIKGKITGFFSGAGSWLVESGKAIIQGLVDGISNMVGAVTDAVGNVMSAARNLLPFSPAKEGPFSGRGWTLYSGRSIVEALAEGVTQKQSAFTGAIASTMSAGQAMVGGLSGGGLNLGSSLGAAYSPSSTSVGGNTYQVTAQLDPTKVRTLDDLVRWVDGLSLESQLRGV